MEELLKLLEDPGTRKAMIRTAVGTTAVMGGIGAYVGVHHGTAAGVAVALGTLPAAIMGGIGAYYMVPKVGLFAANLGVRGAGAMFSAGTASAAGRIGAAAVRSGVDAVSGAESLGRFLLTGSKNRMGWFPKFNTATGIKRFTPNDRIANRLIGIAGVAAIGAGLSAMAFPQAPPPTLYFDGVHMKSQNDMGADANLATAFMGKSSGFNLGNMSTTDKMRLISAL